MKRLSAHTKRKWWYRYIRSINWFSYRFWWLIWLLFILFLLLLILKCCNGENAMCYKGDERTETIDSLLNNCCNCGQNQESDSVNNAPEGTLPCDMETKSGGAGITRTNHFLGNKSGSVTINYDMDNVPDKLEVFYEGKLMTSTRNISGNANGFVGGRTRAGCCGSITFYYEPKQDKYCSVVVTGNQGTIWTYSLGCPN